MSNNRAIRNSAIVFAVSSGLLTCLQLANFVLNGANQWWSLIGAAVFANIGVRFALRAVRTQQPDGILARHAITVMLGASAIASIAIAVAAFVALGNAALGCLLLAFAGFSALSAFYAGQKSHEARRPDEIAAASDPAPPRPTAEENRP